MSKDINIGGRPPHFDSPEKMAEMIEAYFKEGANHRVYVVGKGKEQKEVKVMLYTITGLAYYLGFESRQSFYDYEKRQGFSYIIKKARLRVEQNYEELLQMGVGAGAIFALKNMDWKDKQDMDVTSEGKQITFNLNFPDGD